MLSSDVAGVLQEAGDDLTKTGLRKVSAFAQKKLGS